MALYVLNSRGVKTFEDMTAERLTTATSIKKSIKTLFSLQNNSPEYCIKLEICPFSSTSPASISAKKIYDYNELLGEFWQHFDHICSSEWPVF